MLYILSTGAVTAVGMNAEQTFAAVRAGFSGVETSLPQAPPRDALPCAAVPASTAAKRSARGWLARMLRRALRECVDSYRGAPERLALWIALPEPERRHPALEQGASAFLSGALRPLRRRWSPRSAILTSGHASAAPALLRARELIDAGDIDAAVVGGVDSLLWPDDLERLDAAGRLYRRGQPFGLIPGEAAAFVLVARRESLSDTVPLARICGIGQAVEADHLGTERYATGIGAKDAIASALGDARLDEGEIRWRLTDQNGERYRSWESTLLAARLYRDWRERLPCLHLPAHVGDIGAASLPLQLAVGALALHHGHLPGAPLICEAASEAGLRGACVLDRPDKRRALQSVGRRGFAVEQWLRSADPTTEAAAASGNGVGFRDTAMALRPPPAAGPRPEAVVAAQIERLPHELAWLATHRDQLAGRRTSWATLSATDERIDATLQLADVCGGAAWQALLEGLDDAGAGSRFAPAILAIEAVDREAVERLLPRLLDGPEAVDATVRAAGWVSARHLKGLSAILSTTGSPDAMVLLARSMYAHRVGAGLWLGRWYNDPDPRLRYWALRIAGACGAADAAPQVRGALQDPDPGVRAAAVWASFLLGDRDRALESALLEAASFDDPARRLDRGGAQTAVPMARDAALTRQIIWLGFAALEPSRARALLRDLAGCSGRRYLPLAAAAIGDGDLMPALIRLIDEPSMARAAGDAISTIGGIDLRAAGLTFPPRGRSSLVDADSPEEALPEGQDDDELPWPDPARMAVWWHEQRSQFSGGTGLFLGQKRSVSHCFQVLRSGQQRQRETAAMQCRIFQPGGPLFEISAPSWRQQRLLAAVPS